jgi:hypothetical protein
MWITAIENLDIDLPGKSEALSHLQRSHHTNNIDQQPVTAFPGRDLGFRLGYSFSGSLLLADSLL